MSDLFTTDFVVDFECRQWLKGISLSPMVLHNRTFFFFFLFVVTGDMKKSNVAVVKIKKVADTRSKRINMLYLLSYDSDITMYRYIVCHVEHVNK